MKVAFEPFAAQHEPLLQHVHQMIFRLRTLLASAAMCVAPLEQGHSQTSTGALSPGDQVRISVWNNAALSGDFAIAANGTILHPLYREVNVTGIPLASVEDRLRIFLQKYQTNPQFVVQALVRIIVGGEVRTPNVYSVPPETTVAQAIALAGGPTERANLSQVHMVRDRQDVRVDLREADSDASGIQIRSGDQILIARSRRPVLSILTPAASSVAALAAILSIILR